MIEYQSDDVNQISDMEIEKFNESKDTNIGKIQ